MNNSIYNTPIEIGTRMLCILCATAHKSINVFRLEMYDHMALHAKSTGFEFRDLHPANPSFSAELFGKQSLIEEGLQFMALRGMIDVKYTKRGIYYSANTATQSYVACLRSEYAVEYKLAVEHISKNLDAITDQALRKKLYSQYAKCPGEIEQSLQKGAK